MSTLLRVIVVCAACLFLADGAPDGRLTRAKQQRPTRGFKNVEMMTARGFGKRDGSRAEHISVPRFRLPANSPYLMAPDYGKRSSLDEDEVYGLENFWDMLESPERDTQDVNEDKPLDSIPLEWFVKEMLNNPEFARSVVRKFIDVNQDGMLSSEELLRNVA